MASTLILPRELFGPLLFTAWWSQSPGSNTEAQEGMPRPFWLQRSSAMPHGVTAYTPPPAHFRWAIWRSSNAEAPHETAKWKDSPFRAPSRVDKVYRGSTWDCRFSPLHTLYLISLLATSLFLSLLNSLRMNSRILPPDFYTSLISQFWIISSSTGLGGMKTSSSDTSVGVQQALTTSSSYLYPQKQLRSQVALVSNLWVERQIQWVEKIDTDWDKRNWESVKINGWTTLLLIFPDYSRVCNSVDRALLLKEMDEDGFW